MTIRHALPPGDGRLASALTALVAAWFLVAVGAILVDAPPAAVGASSASPVARAPAPSARPDAHFRIVVEARRGGWSVNPLRAQRMPE